ncbi:MAG: radical SAM protein [Anaerolineae bacterium]
MLASGVLKERVATAYQHLHDCRLCGWDCAKDRYTQILGVCRSGNVARVSSYGAHLGEENPLRGWRGSGTVFFGRCNLRCQYCQNHDISQQDSGDFTEPEDLAEIFLTLQEMGCHNINLVSPTHVVPQILAGVLIAAQAGLHLPIVYNTGGYDSLLALELLDGMVDIYMPDMKYANAQVGLRYSKIRNYPKVNQAAVREMHRQVGDLVLDEDGIATRGLMVRHLVLPNGIAGTPEITRFIAEEISPNTYLNLMDQYRPAFRAREQTKLNRRIKPQEWEEAVQAAHDAGLRRLDHEQVQPRNWIRL